MTSGGPPMQYGQGPGGAQQPGIDLPAVGQGMQPAGWPGNYGAQVPPPRSRGGRLAGIGIGLAVVLSAAALVVGIIATVRQPTTSVTSTPAPTPAASTGDTSAADKALCEKVGPLLKEIAETGQNFVNLGHTGTPARDAGIASYRAAVQDWTNRIQPIVDADSNPSRYLTRTLQSFIDLNQLYADNIRPGSEQPSDAQAWNAGTTAYGGPLAVCRRLGVTW